MGEQKQNQTKRHEDRKYVEAGTRRMNSSSSNTKGKREEE